jgi:hypothetical protein
MEGVHGAWAYAAVTATGLVGAWGLGLAVAKRQPGRIFRLSVGFAVAVMVMQVAFGLVLLQQGEEPGDDFHVFYGVVILFVFAFAYIFRAQISRRPAVVWGILLLFVMDLGLRAWANVGV